MEKRMVLVFQLQSGVAACMPGASGRGAWLAGPELFNVTTDVIALSSRPRTGLWNRFISTTSRRPSGDHRGPTYSILPPLTCATVRRAPVASVTTSMLDWLNALLAGS